MNEIVSRQSKREKWEEVLSRQEGSGVSVAEFCRRAAIPSWKFYYWKRRLRGGENDDSGDDFVEISFSGSGRCSGVWFELPSGLRLVVESGFDVDSLVRVLRTVGSGRC